MRYLFACSSIYSNLNDLNNYGAKWKQPEKFVPKMKKGAKSKNGLT